MPLTLLLFMRNPSHPFLLNNVTPPLYLAYRFLISRLVLETLDPLSGSRKCFRMINGVLVERTVEDVRPALKTNLEGLKKVLEELLKQYKKQQDGMEKWKVSKLDARRNRAPVHDLSLLWHEDTLT